MLVSCGQIGCDWKEWSVFRKIDGTNNYSWHYAPKPPTCTFYRLQEAARKKHPAASFFEMRPMYITLLQEAAVDTEENAHFRAV